jgi:hypothetical protein
VKISVCIFTFFLAGIDAPETLLSQHPFIFIRYIVLCTHVLRVVWGRLCMEAPTRAAMVAEVGVYSVL